MRFISLQSGSNGNCIYVEAGGFRLLFDAGITARQVQNRLALHGRDANAVDAVLISHDHTGTASLALVTQVKTCSLLCACKDYDDCHRRLMDEALRQPINGGTLEIENVAK